MANNYDSKTTIENILKASETLFSEEGFDKISVQKIANKAGVSKGAIYHHFASKEEIMETIRKKQEETNHSTIEQWLSEMDSLTGKQKLIKLLEQDIESQEMHRLDSITSSNIKNAEFILMYMKNAVKIDSIIISQLITQGIVDGSIQSDYPDECAEVFLLLLNYWCDPKLFECTLDKLFKRLKFLQHVLKSLGVDILSDALLQHYYDLLTTIYPERGHTND